MGYMLNVLIDAKDGHKDNNGKGYVFSDLIDESIEHVHSNFINDIFYDSLGNRVSYFSYWETGNHSFFGKNNPERMIEIADSWNREIYAEVQHYADEAESMAKNSNTSLGEALIRGKSYNLMSALEKRRFCSLGG